MIDQLIFVTDFAFALFSVAVFLIEIANPAMEME